MKIPHFENDHDIAAKVTVFPGWALCRRLKLDKVDMRSAGGIVLPDNVEEVARTNTAVMVKAGPFYDPRSGLLAGEFAVPTGTMVEIHPGASTWVPEILKGTEYTVVKSIDLMLAVNQN